MVYLKDFFGAVNSLLSQNQPIQDIWNMEYEMCNMQFMEYGLCNMEARLDNLSLPGFHMIASQMVIRNSYLSAWPANIPFIEDEK